MSSREPAQVRADLPELSEIERLAAAISPHGRVEVLASIPYAGQRFPIHGFVLGAKSTSAPTFALVGGIHGLERIGTQVVLAYLTMLCELLSWDVSLQRDLETSRIVAVPLVNPVGMLLRRRANAEGVDLMRNAPCDPLGAGSPMVGGQRWSSRLPWYMGHRDAPMRAEAAALCNFIRREVLPSPRSLLLDAHSGYGFVDRVWFPYARTRKPLPHLPEVLLLKHVLDRALPNHVYRIEPTSNTYTIQGDLWDHLYDEHRRMYADALFLPLTLEMGSWLWVKKNPRQILSLLGSFNPIKPHRLRRALRRHLMLLEVLRKASASASVWHIDASTRATLQRLAFLEWYAR